jgi:hypothetical protein
MSSHIRELQSPHSVNSRSRDIPRSVPTPKLRATTTLRIKPAIIRQTTNQRQNKQRRQRANRIKNIPQIHPIKLKQISGQMLTELINQFGEPSASPACVPSIHRENTRSVKAKSSSIDSTNCRPSFSLSATNGRIRNAI